MSKLKHLVKAKNLTECALKLLPKGTESESERHILNLELGILDNLIALEQGIER